MLLAACMLFSVLPAGVNASATDEWFTEKDVQGIKTTIISNKSRAAYVDIMMRYHILSETNNHRVERNLRDGKSIVFFFDGCSDNVDDRVLGDFNRFRMSSYCAVVQLKNGVPTIVYESENCSTLPDNPRNPATNEGDPVPTVIDGVYNIISTNHGGSYAALWIENNNGSVPVMRCTQTTSYISTSKYINIHARSQFSGAPTDGITPTSYSSAGCFNVGKVSDSFRDYNNFIKIILGVSNARKPDWNNTKCETGIDKGLVIVDRANYKTQLLELYGGDNSQTASALVGKMTEYTNNITKNLFHLRGDVNGNGNIEKFDYILVKRSILGTYELDGVETLASDINKNGETDKYDYILIKRDILGTYEISE